MRDQARSSGRSVLVADDDPFFRKLIASTLRTRFVVSHVVENGRQLVDSAAARRPGVIVSDVSMPVLGGVAAMHALRDLDQWIPFVMVSADPENARMCLEEGAVAFVDKRDVAKELVAAVLAALSGQTYVSAGAADDPPEPGLTMVSGTDDSHRLTRLVD